MMPPTSKANSQPCDDAALIKRFVEKGDEKAFELLIERHAASVYRFVYSMVGNQQDSEDICQEVFSSAFKALPAYQDQGHFRAWLFRIARNQLLTSLRKSKSRPRIEREVREDDLNTHRDEMSSRGSVSDILAAIDQLSPEERQVVLLRMREGLSFREISELTDIPLGTILSRMQKARQKLRVSLNTLLKND